MLLCTSRFPSLRRSDTDVLDSSGGSSFLNTPLAFLRNVSDTNLGGSGSWGASLESITDEDGSTEAAQRRGSKEHRRGSKLADMLKKKGGGGGGVGGGGAGGGGGSSGEGRTKRKRDKHGKMDDPSINSFAVLALVVSPSIASSPTLYGSLNEALL